MSWAKEEGLCEIAIQAERDGDRAGDLRDLNRVGEAIPEMVRHRGREDLRFVFQPPECASVYDSVTIALEDTAVRMRELRVATATCTIFREP